MPDEQPPDPTAPTPTPVPPPEVPPETGAAEEEPDPYEDDGENAKTRMMVRKAISMREIEMLLVELAKRRAIELLDTASDNGMASKPWYLGGVSAMQVVTVRRWLERFAAPAIINALADQLHDTNKADTELSIAGGPQEKN